MQSEGEGSKFSIFTGGLRTAVLEPQRGAFDIHNKAVLASRLSLRPVTALQQFIQEVEG